MTWNVKEDTVDGGRLLFRGFQRRRNRRKMLDGELDWLQDHQGEESLEGGLGKCFIGADEQEIESISGACK